MSLGGPPVKEDDDLATDPEEDLDAAAISTTAQGLEALGCDTATETDGTTKTIHVDAEDVPTSHNNPPGETVTAAIDPDGTSGVTSATLCNKDGVVIVGRKG